VLLHTGQHYDRLLSGSFLEQLELPQPEFARGVGSGSHAEQTAGVLVGVAQVLEQHRFDAVVVPGDVNSTVAAALAAAKLGVPVVHLEAGLRSLDWTMPEEINRVVTDRICDLLLCPSDDGRQNLLSEGIPAERIATVGNTMIDTLVRLRPVAQALGALEQRALVARGYVLVTLHRPALVDDSARLDETLRALGHVAERLPVMFPSFLGVPCLTYRTTTERPVTTTLGTNRVVGLDAAAPRDACDAALSAPMPGNAPTIPLWDGAAGERAAARIAEFIAAVST